MTHATGYGFAQLNSRKFGWDVEDDCPPHPRKVARCERFASHGEYSVAVSMCPRCLDLLYHRSTDMEIQGRLHAEAQREERARLRERREKERKKRWRWKR